MENVNELKTLIGKYEKPIFDFDSNNNFSLFHPLLADKPSENGVYLTIRCGTKGIYTHINIWEDGKWTLNISDKSFIIAFKKDDELSDKINSLKK